MAWIESHQSLLTHRKTGRMARALSISKITTIGHLHALWWWTMDNAPEGCFDDVDIEDIADGACWEGEPQAFIDAIVYAGFAEYVDGHLCLHDWMEYAGKLIVRRKDDAARKRNKRLNMDVQGMSDGHLADGVRTVPYLTVPNITDTESKESTCSETEEVASAVAEEKATEKEKDPPLFVDFWKAYPPRPDGTRGPRKTAVAQFKKIRAADRPLVVDAAKRYAQSREALDGFAPYAAKWLRDERWRDIQEVAQNPQSVQSDTPPEGYSFERYPNGHWKPLGRDHNGNLPYGAHDPVEVTRIHRQKQGQHRAELQLVGGRN